MEWNVVNGWMNEKLSGVKMNGMVDGMVVMMTMRWNKERKINFFSFGKHEVSGDPDFHLMFSA